MINKKKSILKLSISLYILIYVLLRIGVDHRILALSRYMSLENRFIWMEDNYNDCIRAYEMKVSILPSDAEAHYQLGKCYEMAMEYKQAVYGYKKATELDSKKIKYNKSLLQIERILTE